MLTVLAAFVAVTAFSQEKVPYSLPRTSLEFTVKAVRTDFTAGPYAAYASKYLGIDVRTADETSYAISEVSMRSYSEADPSARYFLTVSKETRAAMLRLTSQGLVSNGNQQVKSDWKFPARQKQEFTVRPANLTNASGAMGREVVVEKGEEAKAAEVAKRIFAIRENKYNILVGDTDATYSGEAMKTAIDALDAMEAELMELFVGRTSSGEQQAVFEIIPESGMQNTVAFRLSQTSGLVAPDDYSGTPWFVEIVPEPLAAPLAKEEPAPAQGKKGRQPVPVQTIRYRVPVVCSVSLGDGVTVLLNQRVPVYQLGEEIEYPIY